MGKARFSFGGLAAAVLITGVVMHNEGENPGGTARGVAATRDAAAGTTGELVAAVPQAQQVLAPAVESVGGLVSGATAAAAGPAPAAGGAPSAADATAPQPAKP